MPEVTDPGAFSGFPAGCCEYASLYLARYMIQAGTCDRSEIRVRANNSFNERGQSHAWLMIKDRWHVDITADQFGKNLPKVIVAETSDFHEGFEPPIWDPYDKAAHFVFTSLGSKLTYIGRVWDALQDRLPKAPCTTDLQTKPIPR